MLTSRRSSDPPVLLERDRAVDAVAAAFDAAGAGSGRVVVLTGPPGIGKTRLLEIAQSLGRDRGAAMRRARGADSETAYPFGGVLQLFERDVDAALLSGAAELARPVFDGRFLAGEGGQLASAVHGLFWLTVNLAELEPVVLVIDDLHALDEPTLAYLLYLARRIEDLPVSVIAATRPPETLGRPALSELAFAPAVTEVPLEPLSLAAVAELVRAEFDPEADEEFCHACARVSGGNPFYLEEALRELASEHTPATREGARRLSDVEPQAVARAVLLRLARLAPDAVALARAGALLGSGSALELVAELAGVPLDAALDAGDALVGGAILEAVDPFSFAHALVAAAIAADLPAGRRGGMHRQAAELLIARHAPVERIATHLLSSPPGADQRNVDALRLAAAHARDAGLTTMAVGYLQRALAESAPGRDQRATLLLELARAEIGVDPVASGEHIAEAVTIGAGGHDAGALRLELGRALYVAGRHAEAAETFLRAVEQLEPGDPLVRELQAWFISASVFVASHRPRALELAGAIALDPPEQPTLGERGVLAQVAVQAIGSGSPLRQVRPLVDRAWGDGALLREETCDGYQWMHLTAALSWGGDYAAAGQIADAVLEDARRRGSVMAFATASYVRASMRLFTGQLLDGLADAAQTLEAHHRDGWSMFLGAAHFVHAALLLEHGEIDAAAVAAEMAGDERFAGSAEGALLRVARGRTRVAQGRWADAAADLESAQAWAVSSGIGPARLLPVWDALAEARMRLGDPDGAREALDAGEAVTRRAELPDLQARVLVARARWQEEKPALETLRHATELAAGSQGRIELARARVALGARLRRAGRRSDALAELRPALDLAHRLGAAPLEALAREELAVLGSRPRRPHDRGVEALTASELRTARLAADGRSNREIAEALFVTPKTVEYHLRNAFMKLDVASRRELAGALERDE